MWVFDGEEWTNDAADVKRLPESPKMLPGEFYPELQVVEILPIPTRTDIKHVPQPQTIP